MTAETSDLQFLFDDPGPFASVYLSVPPETHDVTRARAAIWSQLGDTLARSGAPDGVLAGVHDHLDVARPDLATIAVVASERGVLFVDGWEEPRPATAWWQALPALGSILEERARVVPHLVVRFHEGGVDLLAVTDATPELTDDAVTLRPDRSTETGAGRGRSIAAGDFGALVELIEEEVARVEPELISVSGDQGMVSRFTERAHPDVLASAEVVRGDDPAAVARSIDSGLERVRSRRTSRLRDRIDDARASGLLAEGADRALEAVRTGSADAVVVVDDPGDERVAWFGPEPCDVAATRAGLRRGPGTEGRMVDVLIRAGLLTATPVHVVASDLAIAEGCAVITSDDGPATV